MCQNLMFFIVLINMINSWELSWDRFKENSVYWIRCYRKIGISYFQIVAYKITPLNTFRIKFVMNQLQFILVQKNELLKALLKSDKWSCWGQRSVKI